MVVGGSNIHERLAHFFIDIYNKIDGKDLQLLVEADLIAGCTEEDDPSAHAKAVRRLFKSSSGLALLDTFIKE